MFVGSQDLLATPKDNRENWKLLGAEAAFHYEEIESDHLAFMIGKDMTWFTETAMDIIRLH